MKLAIAGKGGSGKTSIAGTMARQIGRGGKSVLAIDGDSNPNLALTLGVSAEKMNDVPTLPRDLLQRDEDEGGWKLRQSIEELRETHSLQGPDDVTLLVMAHAGPEDAGKGCFCNMHATVRSLIDSAGEDDADVTLLDTEASPEHLTRGTAKFTELMLTVVEPYYKSLETGRRMAALGHDLGVGHIMLIANKIRDDEELAAVQEFADKHDLELGGVVPFDDVMREAEQASKAPLDYNADAPAMKAIGEIADRITSNGYSATNGSEA